MVAAQANAMRVVGVSDGAALAGLMPGQTLADARAIEPGLHAVPSDPERDRHDLARLAAWCGRYSPWTAAEPDDETLEVGGAGIWLDISGCAHLFGGEGALLDDLTARVQGLGFNNRVAIADTPGAAWAVARFGDGGIVASGEERTALAALPPGALRLPSVVVGRLLRLGIRRIDGLLALPRAGLTARYGDVVARRLDQALGREGEPISPQQPPPRLTAQMSFAEPIGRPEDIDEAMRQLLDDITAQLTAAEQGARQVCLTLFRCNGQAQPVIVGTSRPNRDPAHLHRLLDEQLARLPEIPPHEAADALVDLLRLEVQRGDLMAGTQPGLGRGLGGSATSDALAPLIDRLANRLGADNVLQLHPRESHLPERAQVAHAALEDTDDAALGATTRPVRLLTRPEMISAVAPVPDDPPVLFRWRGRTIRVRRADGPERLAPEWWRDAAIGLGGMLGHETRDYYRVEDGDGRRYWLFRRGLYGDQINAGGSAKNTLPQWFLHGFFG